MTSERDIQTQILLELSRGDTRLFRINAGTAWQGVVAEHTRDRLVLAHPRAVRLAAPGVSDLIGWAPGGRFAAVEVKAPRGRATPEQLAFLELVQRSGGVAGIARSVDEAWKIIRGIASGEP